MRRYSQAFERDYSFYESNMNRFTFAGSVISIEPNNDRPPVDAKKAFFVYDSTGRIFPCHEAEKFEKLLICKKAINLQLKAWADGFVDCVQTIEELLESFEGEVPDWIEESLRNQIKKRHGHTPEHLNYLAYKEYYESMLTKKRGLK